ncbi:MAG: class I SAM-dependent methyltransferase [Burkholderiales bacterium]
MRFDLRGSAYARDIVRCRSCGHMLSIHDIDLDDLYAGRYVDATYGPDGLRRAFDRIVALPPARSDNVARVERVVEWMRTGRARTRPSPTVLDVGSGLCVFLHRLRAETGWRCVALDPDPRAAEHAGRVAGVEGVRADFMTAHDVGLFDLISFNKVLEHVADPIAMLERAHDLLAEGGAVYIEVPDGERACTDGPGREEFFIDHHHVFSERSTAVLAEKSGFAIDRMERLREPSGKYTLFAFLSNAPT